MPTRMGADHKGRGRCNAGPDARSRSITSTDAGREKRVEAQRHWKTAQLRLNEILEPDRVAALHALVDQCLVLLDDEPAGQLSRRRHA